MDVNRCLIRDSVWGLLKRSYAFFLVLGIKTIAAGRIKYIGDRVKEPQPPVDELAGAVVGSVLGDGLGVLGAAGEAVSLEEGSISTYSKAAVV